MALDNDQIQELLEKLREVEPTVDYAPEESFKPEEGEAIDFQDSCGCYSEWTTDSCSLYVHIKADLPLSRDHQYELRNKLSDTAEDWAHRNLSWDGCSSCGDHLSVMAYLYQRK